MAEDKKPAADLWTHAPLPYIVYLRETLANNDDTVPTFREERVIGYSIMEALLSAVMQAGGTSMDDSRFRVERIGPDLPAFYALIANGSGKGQG